MSEPVIPGAFLLDRTGTSRALSFDLGLGDQVLADGTVLDDVLRIDFRGGSGADTATGGDFADTLIGGGGADTLNGGAGADLLSGLSGYRIYGGADGDLIQVRGAGTVDGGAGYDVLQVGASTTFVAGSLSSVEEIQVASGVKLGVSALTSGLTIRAADGASGGISVLGGAGADLISGGPGPNTLDGASGSDTLLGGPSRDLITAGPGFDVVFAYGGDDTIQVKRGTGPDQIDGGEGSDLLNADYATAAVRLQLDISNPLVVQALGDGSTIVGIEQLKIIGGAERDTFTGGALNDTLSGGLGDDVLRGAGGSDVIDGGDGYDVAVYARPRDAYQVTALGGGSYAVSGGPDLVDTLTGIETLRFSDGDMPIGGYTPTSSYWGSPNGADTLISSTPVVDGRGAGVGTGFTNTGMTRAPDGTWWLANQGQADAADTTYTPSLVHLSSDLSTKLGEIALGGKIRSLQGVAYDTATDQLLVASLSEHIVRVVNLNGSLGPTISLGSGVSPNALAYDPVLNAAIIGRSDGSTNSNIVEWRSAPGGAVIKTLTLANNPDHFYFDATKGAQGVLYYSWGASGGGAVGYVAEVDVASSQELGRYVLRSADAIEGIYLSGGVLWANNDAYYHRGEPPVNSVLQFAVTPIASIVNRGQTTAAETIDLGVHDQTLADGARLVGAERIFFLGGSGQDRVTGGDAADVIVGDGGNDTLSGAGGDDRLVGGDAADLLNGGGGDDGIEGGPGADVAVFSGARADYQVIALGGTSALVVDARPGSPDGRDRVVDVETFRFSDADFSYTRTVKPGVAEVRLSDVVVAENSSGGAVVGDLSAVFDAGQTTFTYSLPDDANGRFAIVGSHLTVAPGAVLDYESAPVHEVTVRATAANGSFLDQTFTLGLTDVNEAPTDLRAQNVIAIPQYTSERMRVADLAIEDADVDPAFRAADFTVADPRFEVVDGSLYLKAGQTLNWGSHSVDVQVTAVQGGFSLVRTIALPITEAPAPVVAISLSGGFIAEGNTAGAAVGTLSAVDAAGDSRFTFALLDDNGGRFVLQGDQLLVAWDSGLNYENGATRDIVVRATAANGSVSDKTFTVTVTDVDEAPTNITLLDPTPLVDNTSGPLKIGDLLVADPDIEPAFRMHVLSVDDPRFEIIGGALYLRDGVTLDAETEPTVTLELTVAEGPFTYSRTIELPVAAQPTGVVVLSGAQADENSGAGTVCGTLALQDGSTGYSYALQDDDGGRFQLAGDKIVVAPGAALDFESAAERHVAVRATGPGGAVSAWDFEIRLNDLNEAPTAVAFTDVVALPEHTTARTRVADLAVSDPDTAPANRTYELAVDDPRFELADGSLYLKAGQVLDASGGGVIPVQITVTDGAFVLHQTLSVTVVPTPAGPAFTLESAALDENSAAGSVGGVLATPAQNVAFTLLNDDGGRFLLQQGQLVLAPGGQLDFESAATRQVRVRATGPDGGVSEKDFSIVVRDLNEAPTAVTLTATSALVENTTARTRLADLVVSDPDTAPAFRTHLLSVDDPRFEISDGSLYLRAGQVVDFEAAAVIPLQITVSDGPLTYRQTVNLPVQDIAETAGPFVLDRAGTALGLSVDLALSSQTLADGTVLGAVAQIDFRGGTGADTVLGGAAADTLTGGGGADWLSGGLGDDVLSIAGSPAKIDGGGGQDVLNISGTATFAAGSLLGVERITVQAGGRANFSALTVPVTVNTGAGSASVSLTGGSAADTLTGGAGPDSLDGGGGSDLVSGGAGADRIVGGSGRDTMIGGDGDDVFEIKRSTGPDEVDGGPGSDLLSADFGKMTAGMAIDIGNPGLVQTLPDGTTLVNIEQLSVTTGAGADRVLGGALADSVTGLAGDDTLSGGAGADNLNGSDGNDLLIGGLGDDTLTGGTGADRYAPGANGWGVDRIVGFEDGVDVIDLRGFALTYGGLTISQSAQVTTIDAGPLGSILLLSHTAAMTAGDFLFV